MYNRTSQRSRRGGMYMCIRGKMIQCRKFALKGGLYSDGGHINEALRYTQTRAATLCFS